MFPPTGKGSDRGTVIANVATAPFVELLEVTLKSGKLKTDVPLTEFGEKESETPALSTTVVADASDSQVIIELTSGVCSVESLFVIELIVTA
jgi:hypothetical protein